MTLVQRRFYGGVDLSDCVLQIDRQLTNMAGLKYLSKAIEFVRLQFPHISRAVMRRRYNEWIKLGKPEPYIYNDQRINNMPRRALTDKGEILVFEKILELNQSHSQVTYQTVRKLSLQQWSSENLEQVKEYPFIASDGWIKNFIKRYNLSSQLISKHSSAKTTAPDPKQLAEIETYKKMYQKFLLVHGTDHVYNFDETSFADTSGSRTITSKRSVKKNTSGSIVKPRSDQPSIKNYVGSHQRISIGCTIALSGERLKPIVNVKGLTNRCTDKYKTISNRGKVILTHTKSSWFQEETLRHVLYQIHRHSQGQKALCIWDAYKPHLQSATLDLAKRLNIKILQVPKGMTYKYQPLDALFNGVFKSLMKSYWLNHRYNENKENVCQHMIETTIHSYYSIKPETIKQSFMCIGN